MPTNAELARLIAEISGDHMALRAAFESHREHCATDKVNMNSRLDSINNKLWAGLVLLLFQFVALAGYLAINGTPWNKTPAAEVAKR